MVDVVIRGATIHTFGRTEHARSIAWSGERITAVSVGPQDLDPLISESTLVVDGSGLTITPGFTDTHIHSYQAALDTLTIQIGSSRNIADMSRRIAEVAASAPEGSWLFTSKDWRDSDLAEGRPPSRAELDAITTRHPLCVRRGSHAAFANTAALRAAGLVAEGRSTGVDEPHLSSGALIGDEAIAPVIAFLPKPDRQRRVDALAAVTRSYNERGIVAIRDAGLDREGLETFQDAADAGRLSVRSRVMVRLDERWPLDAILTEIDRWSVRSGLGDNRLRLDGLKFFVDGRIDDAAMHGPCGLEGALHLDANALTEAVTLAAGRGWIVGCHTCGDAAMDVVLDAFDRAIGSNPEIRGEQFTIEHAFFVNPEQLERATRLGIGFSVHPAILYAFAANMVEAFGDRVEDVMPVRELLAAGARVAAGSDGHVPPYDPLLGIAVLQTRQTSIGRQLGVAHALTREQAFELYTAAGPRLFGEEESRGTLEAGKLADLVLFERDPLACGVEELLRLQPSLTLLGGDAVYDREGMLAELTSLRHTNRPESR